ncbi:MAG: DUF3810 domain-containing protein [Oscillospiraceae bacterium]|nr:DUF3810 domain-containing protein [Oscillospiraceae bacterium]
MRSFLRYFKGLHIWLAVNAAALVLFVVFRTHRSVMNAVANGFSMPLERALGRMWSFVPFSVAELCYAAAVIGLAVFLVRSVVLVCRAEYKREALYRRAMTLLNLVLSVLAAFCLFWGVNFYADDFCDRSGLIPRPVAREELIAATRYFADKTAQYSTRVPRDENGVCSLSRQAAMALAPTLYEPLYAEFPFLNVGAEAKPKGIFCSRVMSAIGFTGVYFPFTGESNLNMDFPVATFPATLAHELAHRRGIASEQQCNFLAVLASTRSQDDAFCYSGWLLGYIHLSNALYAADAETWREIRLYLPEGAEADLLAASDYWAQYESPVSETGEKIYDSVLRGYGDELGMKSYGAVVDLLVLYYIVNGHAQ